MLLVNIYEVKAKLSEYVDRAAAGEHVLICRHNRPIVELRAIAEVRTTPRPIGPLPGRPTFDIASQFFDQLSDAELREWEDADLMRPPASSTPASKTSRAPRVAESSTPFRTSRRRPAKRRS
jgi:prevent-host-death family protein